VLQGGTYALAAFGLSSFSALRTFSTLPMGILMLGGLVTYIVYAATGWNPFLILLIVIPLFMLVVLFSEGVHQADSEQPPRQLLFRPLL